MAMTDLDAAVQMYDESVMPFPTPPQYPGAEVQDEELGSAPRDTTKSSLSESNDSFKAYEAPAVGSSTNILLLYHLQALRIQYWVNLLLSVICLVLMGINVALLVLNSLKEEVLEEYRPQFHGMEFWATFTFSLVELFGLTFSPKPMKSIYYKPVVLKILVAFSVTIALVPAILMSIDLERFEFSCHNVEYTANIVMALIDSILFMTLFKVPGVPLRQNIVWLTLSSFSLVMAVACIAVYNTVPGHTGEQISHYIEFSFNIINAGTLFWFCSDNRLLVEHWIRSTLTPQDGLTPHADETNKRE